MAKKNVPPNDPAKAPPSHERRTPARVAASAKRSSTARLVSPDAEVPYVAHDIVDREPWPSYVEIAEAAYQRYLSRGGGHGHDVDDWLDAEQELRRRSR
jgi:Protein of unknown function (DUF2934)